MSPFESMTSDVLLTDLIRQAQEGDSAALQAVFDATYEDLRRMARARLTPNQRGTLLDTTSLVHESFLRLANAGQLGLEDRMHFFRYAGKVMRSVVVDIARASQAARRGGDVERVTLNTAISDSISSGEEEILRVHEALADLAKHDERLVQVVEMRYFAGMSEMEIAQALGVTDRTVRRDWEKARLLLAQALA
ncbi:MAG TPA: ECF-type sigma factor [Steroidobacteraceae bacterium]